MNEDKNNFKIQFGLKRFCDLVITIPGLILLSPVIAGIALAIKFDSKGPVVFRHQRIGRNGMPFELLKFRTMVSGGDDKEYMKYLQELIESERNGDCAALPYTKLNGDSRVTRVGKFLRCYYLDELPQLWNVIKGEMSLVGPRPHVQFEVDYYNSEQQRRLTVMPGLTGLWQVSAKADCTFGELIELDLKYIDQWNLVLDFQIIFTTIVLMLRGGEGFWARMAKRIPQRFSRNGGNGSQPREATRLSYSLFSRFRSGSSDPESTNISKKH